MDITQHYSVRNTPQTQPIPGQTTMIQGASGGWAFPVDSWTKLDRFLILGTEGGTYYASEQKLTVENCDNVLECIKEDGERVVNRIVEVSDKGLAAKNDYALFALALVMTFAPKRDGAGSHTLLDAKSVITIGEDGRILRQDGRVRNIAYNALPKVARTGTHLFTFLNYIKGMRGWSRGLRSSVSDWYGERSTMSLLNQLTKYRQRGGFSHRDALRLAHPDPYRSRYNDGVTKNELFSWAVGKPVDLDNMNDNIADYLAAADYLLKGKATVDEAIKLINDFNLPREVLSTSYLKTPEVWAALLGENGQRMGLTALIRNLGNLTNRNVLKPMTSITESVAARIADPEEIKTARVHPFSILCALMTYSSGAGLMGSNTWSPISSITEGLEAAFHAAHENVESSNKRIIYAVDVSGSMGWGNVAGVPYLTPAMAAGALALTCAKKEDRFQVWGFDHNLYSLPIYRTSSLDSAMRAATTNGGMTDASLPFKGAIQNDIEVDAFVFITDAESWAGSTHTYQSLQNYRMRMGVPAKMITMAMTANGISLSAPEDAGCMNVVGCSTDTPRLVGDFIRE